MSRGGPREMFPAVCAQCGQNTQVPFQPRGDKPVYCRDCYNKSKA
jgi:CxxC-x17-CxxC domain-containing protein